MNVTRFGKEKLPSVIKDPFGKTMITEIWVRYAPELFNGKWMCSGSVGFKNGNTKGEQKFQAETFDDVVLQIKAMIENL